MADLVYLIEKIWVDPLENLSQNALGYKVIGFVTEEQTAKDFCSKGRMFTPKDCWAIGTRETHNMPEYKYTPIPRVETP